jgi:hypothetical protein
MSEADDFIAQLLSWDGSEALPAKWADEHDQDVLSEAQNMPLAMGRTRLIGGVLERLLEQLTGSDHDSARLGPAGVFASSCDAAAVAFHKLWGFVSAAARRRGSLWNSLLALVHQYASKLKAIARELGAAGYWISVNVPVGISFGVTFGA